MKIKIHFIKVKNVKKCEKMWKNVKKGEKMCKIEKKTQCSSSKTPPHYSTGVKSLLDGRVKTELCNYVQGGVCTFFSKFWKTKIKIHFIIIIKLL